VLPPPLKKTKKRIFIYNQQIHDKLLSFFKHLKNKNSNQEEILLHIHQMIKMEKSQNEMLVKMWNS
jgi:hypothetical protein